MVRQGVDMSGKLFVMVKAATLVLALTIPLETKAAPARDIPPADTSVLKNLTDCRKLPTKDERADCYDAAVDSLSRAQTEGKIVVIDQEKLKTVRRQAFGFNLPSLSGLAKGFKEEPIDVVMLKIAEAHEESDERWVIETTEQAVWRQTQSSGFPLSPHAGDTLTIKPGMLGGFFCQVGNQVQFRCKRDH